jgi:hypothetical protein
MSIKITSSSGPNTIKSINFGTSTPKLSGSINVTYFNNLSSLYCASNGISAINGYENLEHLEYFICNDNLLSGEFPTLTGLNSIKWVYLHQNNLSGVVPEINSNTLEELRIYQNKFTRLPSNFSGTPNLIKLYTHSNNLSGDVPDLNGLLMLTDFSCETNNLTGAIPPFYNIPNLETFSCNNNNLNYMTPTLSGAPKLTRFLCQSNSLSGSIPPLNGLSALTNFQCQANPLTGTIPDFTDCPELVTFTATSTKLQYMPLDISGAPKLTTFNIFLNPSLSGTFPALSGNVDLVTIGAYGCSITGSIPDLSQNTKLATINAYNNKLSEFDGRFVSPTLGTLGLYNNRLTMTAVNNAISSVAVAGKSSGTRSLQLQLGTNSAPDFTTNVYTISAARVGVTGFPAGTFVHPANSYTVTANITGHNLLQGDIITASGITSTPANLFNRTTKVENVITPNQFTFTVPISSSSSVSSANSTTGRIRKSLTLDSVLYRYQQLTLPNSLGGLGWTVTINFP